MAVPLGFEPKLRASEALVLSITLRNRGKVPIPPQGYRGECGEMGRRK